MEASGPLTLVQGSVALNTTSVILRTELLSPLLAARVPRSFSVTANNGFAISAAFPPDPQLAPGLACVEASLSWSDGGTETLRLATISVERVPPYEFDIPVGPDTIGIALAAYNPDIALFHQQIGSIRQQTHTDWVCAISDDCSAPTLLTEMRAVLHDDRRFVLVPATANAGFYRNFERAVALLPEQCGWIAFADHDDAWLPAKLEILLREAKRTESPLVFSDMEVYSDNGRRLADTFWTYRRLETKNAAAIAVANTVTGMAMLAHSSVLDAAMPFPALPGTPYHDRWFALAALARGELHYVAQPLVRYIQHAGNHTGTLRRPAGGLVLLYRFLKCLAECVLALFRPSRRNALPERLEACARWSSVVALSLSVQIETLQRRLPQPSWRPDVWDQFHRLKARPTLALLNLSLKSLLDPYRRHMVAGLVLGSSFHSLVDIGLKGAGLMHRLRSSPKPKFSEHVRR
jgi:glycosyltransferase involved in cell wall biosynthesis